MIKEEDVKISKPKQNLEQKPEKILKRLNLENSTKTKRRLGLFGCSGNSPDFEWTLITKLKENNAE